ncbi:UNVERIFIED_CONTAM: hypothetical protein Slati_0061800 [Sesamum latifolium]|uniref:TPX2 C-terminal domain-containing protein n=1 Tax=Sesamum latifolium TaxID=2727402 RepID=A0AAW2Y7L2_9LAMI
MGDSACLMHGFSYASAMPNESKQGNRLHVLGESVSFGRFMTESLSWERWSTFSSHKKYVEEAQRYAQPGSVWRRRRLFFEAHYKKIAAQKAAAALLEQENAAKVEAEKEAEGDVDNSGDDQQRAVLNSQLVLDVKMEEEPKIQDVMEDSEVNASAAVAEIRTEEAKVEIKGNEVSRERSVNRRNSIKQLDILENQETFSGSEGSGTPLMERPWLKASTTKGVSNYPAATPRSENRRLKTPIDPSAPGRKTTGPKWHILSAVYSKSLTACRNRLQSPTLSTPFILRTEERAAKRKTGKNLLIHSPSCPLVLFWNLKLEEKFNANEMQNAQLQKTLKEKAGNEFSKLGCGFCFKARPLPEFYKERETSVNQMKKTPARAQPAVLGRSISNKTRGTISMPPPPPPPTSLPKNRVSKNLSKKTF